MKRAEIRSFYESVKEIADTPPYLWALALFELDPIINHFTPIEVALWSDLREEGAVMYPQFPVAGYFVDFGNPVAKVAIECDGAHHKLQRDADAKRQAEIESLGWTVFRLTGGDCLRSGKPLCGTGTYEVSPSVRMIREIATEFPICARMARRMEGYVMPKRDSWEQFLSTSKRVTA